MSDDIADHVAIEVAGKAAGIPARTLRYWVASGKLSAIAGKRGKLVSMGEVERLAVIVGKPVGNANPPDGNPAMFADEVAGNVADRLADSALVSDAARNQLAAIRDEWLAPLIERIGELERENGRLEATIEAKDETIAELQSRAHATQAALVGGQQEQEVVQADTETVASQGNKTWGLSENNLSIRTHRNGILPKKRVGKVNRWFSDEFWRLLSKAGDVSGVIAFALTLGLLIGTQLIYAVQRLYLTFTNQVSALPSWSRLTAQSLVEAVVMFVIVGLGPSFLVKLIGRLLVGEMWVHVREAWRLGGLLERSKPGVWGRVRRRWQPTAEKVAPAAPPPPSATPTRHALEDAPRAPGGAGGLWARVRRVFGGG